MKIHIIETINGPTISNQPFLERVVDGSDDEGGTSSTIISVTTAQWKKIKDPTYLNKYEDGVLTFEKIETEKTQEELKKEELKEKAEAGTLTDKDIQEAIKLIL